MSRSDEERIQDILEISAEFKGTHPEVDWKSVLGMRTYLAHAYHRIDANIVWNAASISVPALVTSLSKNS